MTEPMWLSWAREMQAIAQSGLTFTKEPYERERYEKLRALAANIMAHHSSTEVAVIENLFAEQTGYATPKVDVRGAIFQDGKILMIRETADQGRWTLPGGWADVNDSPSECVIREVLEESGFEAKISKLAAVWDRAKHPHEPPFPFHLYKLFFIGEVIGGLARTSLESEEVAFFAETDLPSSSELSRSRVLDYQLHRMFEHFRNSNLPTEFD